jgi:hypothetical protein
VVVADLVVVAATVVTVAIEDPDKDKVAEVVATTDTGAMGQPTAPRTANSLPTQYLLLVLWL